MLTKIYGLQKPVTLCHLAAQGDAFGHALVPRPRDAVEAQIPLLPLRLRYASLSSLHDAKLARKAYLTQRSTQRRVRAIHNGPGPDAC